MGGVGKSNTRPGAQAPTKYMCGQGVAARCGHKGLYAWNAVLLLALRFGGVWVSWRGVE